MAYDLRTPRSRGSLCGLALVLLGGWAGVAPFAGPSFGFGYTPDAAWHYTSGRLYLSALPGAVVLAAGLIITFTRSRSFGGLCAFVAALAGGWLIAGATLIRLLPASQAASITPGSPMGSSTSVHVLTQMAFFAGAGAVIVFVAALALGRFSMTALRDYVGPAAADQADAAAAAAGYGAMRTGQDLTAPQPYSASQQYGGQYSSGPTLSLTGQYDSTDEYRSASAPSQNPASAGPFGLTQDWPAANQPAAAEPTTVVERPPGQQPGQEGSSSPGS